MPFIGARSLLALWIVAARGLTARAVQTAGRVSSLLEKVKVRVYGEAGCRFTRAYLNGPVRQALDAPDIVKMMDFEFSPFGNAFFITKQCQAAASASKTVGSGCGAGGGYDSGVRSCFNALCGVGVVNRSRDCFTGPLVCQHGFKECAFNRYFACAKRVALGSSNGFMSYMPFVLCMTDKYSETQGGDLFLSLLRSCADVSALPLGDLQSCYTSEAGTQALAMEAASTPDHPGVPHVTVSGYTLEESYEPLGLVLAVQSAHWGVVPPVGAVGSVAARHDLVGSFRRVRAEEPAPCNATDADAWLRGSQTSR